MKIGKPKKIFIVDDDPMLTEALQDYLTRSVPHQISVFSTGEECLKQLSQLPDIIVLDYYLNSVNKNAADGMQVLQTIKKQYPHVHVIMLSAQEHYGVAMRSIQKGAEQYVIKDEHAFEKIARMINDFS